MATLFLGSLQVSELLEQLKAGHDAFKKANNGKIYANVQIWLNDKPDDYGNILSVQLNPAKDSKFQKKYIINAKEQEVRSKDLNADDVSKIVDEFEQSTNNKDIF